MYQQIYIIIDAKNCDTDVHEKWFDHNIWLVSDYFYLSDMEII